MRDAWDYDYSSEPKLPKYPSIGYASAMNTVTGYGKQGFYIARNLVGAGLDVYYHEITDYAIPQFEERPSLLNIIEREGVPEWGLVHSVAEAIDKLPNPKKIMWTMWEADHIPDSRGAGDYKNWKERINKQAQALIVPATEQKKIFKRSGIKVPIHIVHDAVDTDFWAYRPKTRPEGRPLTFFTWAFMNSRKAPMETVNCFISAFGPNNPNVRLIVKTIQGQFGMGKGQIPTFPGVTNVEIINKIWREEELRDFIYDNVDVGFFLSKGEGFYDPPLEALALGIPVIVPDHSGPHDYCDDHYVYPIRLHHMEEAPQSRDCGSYMKWWVPDYDHAIHRLKDVYENYEMALEKGRLGAQWVKDRWSLEHQRGDLIKVLNEVCS